jgi:hypothetical protein
MKQPTKHPAWRVEAMLAFKSALSLGSLGILYLL